jgi:capsid protein
LEPLDIVALEKRMATTLPDGWKLGQIRAEQPNTTYSEFKREILGEIGRCMQMPVNILLGDSSKHNYASGRLDHQTFFKSIKGEQTSCEQIVLNPIFDAWYREALRVGLFREPAGAFPIRKFSSPLPPHAPRLTPLSYSLSRCWFWDGLEHVDPMKEANAAATRIETRTSNLAIECAKLGLDWEDVLNQAAKERRRMIELKLDPDTKIILEKDKDEEDSETDEADASADTDPPRRGKRKRAGDSGSER